MKPILFNGDMVRAILGGRKTQTRRVCTPQPTNPRLNNIGWLGVDDGHGYPMKPPCKPGDILYVRETWKHATGDTAGGGYGLFDTFAYKADGKAKDNYPVEQLMTERSWHPSIFMPKEAARIFLRVTDVRVERLKNITCAGIEAEGIESERPLDDSERLCEYCPLPEPNKGIHCYGGNPIGCEGSHCYEALEMWEEEYKDEFAELWDSTVKRSELYRYGWDANPWVWVIEFERFYPQYSY